MQPSAAFVRKPLMFFPASLSFAGAMTRFPKVPFAASVGFTIALARKATVPTFAASVSFVGSFTKLRLQALRAFVASIQPWGKGGKGPVGYIDYFLPPYKWVERIYQTIARWD